jgi:hypothetical protein
MVTPGSRLNAWSGTRLPDVGHLSAFHVDPHSFGVTKSGDGVSQLDAGDEAKDEIADAKWTGWGECAVVNGPYDGKPDGFSIYI